MLLRDRLYKYKMGRWEKRYKRISDKRLPNVLWRRIELEIEHKVFKDCFQGTIQRASEARAAMHEAEIEYLEYKLDILEGRAV